MKKLFIVFIFTILFIPKVYAFEIDVDKIKIDSKSSTLIKNLDDTYNIDTNDFDKKIVYDEKIQELVKKVISISISDDDLQTKKSNIVQYMFLSSTNGFDNINGMVFIEMYLKILEEYNLKFDYIKDIKTVPFNENDKLALIYISDALVDGETKDIVFAYWLKSNDGVNYGIYYPWVTIDDTLDDYFAEISDSEEKGEIIGTTFNQMSLNDSGNVVVNKSLMNTIYNNNIGSVVQITGMNSNGFNTYGSGFVIREGVIVTTWSLFLKFLTHSNYIFVNDAYGNTYDILGVVSAQVDYDVVVLKVEKEIGQKVILGDSSKLNSSSNLFTINSKDNNTFSINYGVNLSVRDGRLENMFPLSDSDVGSALFNEYGEVVGFNVSDLLYSELSYANSTNYLKELQTTLVNIPYDSIRYTVIDTFKQSYYMNFSEEVKANNVPSNVWNKYKNIGNLDENIKLDLLKSSYVDNILSLRYKNNSGGSIDSLYLLSKFVEDLLKQGYQLTYQDNDKVIYANNKYKIIIKNNFNYLIIVIMEI